MADTPHVMLLPWLALGHMLPFLELAKSFASKGLRVSFVSTPRNILRLPPIPPSLKSRLKLLEVQLPQVEGLQEGLEATIDLPLQKVPYLKMAFDGLKPSLQKLLSETSPDLVVCDFVSFWVHDIASRLSIPTAYFSVFSAATLAFIGAPTELRACKTRRQKPEDFMVPPDWLPFASSLAYRGNQAVRINEALNVPDESGLSSGQRIAVTIQGCDFVLVRSCPEFEGEYLNLLADLYGKPVFPMGLLLPPETEEKNRVPPHWSTTFDWLDKRANRSVVFVGFGSEYKITRHEVEELAYGLELSEIPFVWALRRPSGGDSSFLPQGFEARTGERGMVCFGWVPQLDILAHPAIGGCLFHSGWGSIAESLLHGHGLILLPMMADQGLNARLLVDKGLGLEIERGVDGDSFTRHSVAKGLRHVMMDPAGEPLRQRAREIGAVVANRQLHQACVDQFLEYFQGYNKGKVGN